MATQSSWLYTLALVIVTPSEDPISNPSVLCPPALSPSDPSMVMSVRASVCTPFTLKTCTGGFTILMPEMVESVRSCAWKNFGFVLPPLLPSLSHHRDPSPFNDEPEAPVTVISVPLTATSGPSHSS